MWKVTNGKTKIQFSYLQADKHKIVQLKKNSQEVIYFVYIL